MYNINKNLFLFLVLRLVVCQNWTVQVCTACEYSFDWHPYCEEFDKYANHEGYFVVEESDINGLDSKMREEISSSLLWNRGILLNTSVKVFNSFTRMITATRSFMYTSTRDGVVPLPLCDLASAAIAKTEQRQQCSVCASVHNYDYIEWENSCCVDLSAPFFYSPTTVLYRKDFFFKTGASIFFLFLDPKFLEAVRNIICWIMLYALIIRYSNPQIFKDKEKQCGQCSRLASISIWLAVATFTTVGYGDYVVNRRLSRIITIVYMFGSLVISSYLIGVCLDLVSNRGTNTYFGLEDSSQISGRNICIPGYYYYVFEEMVLSEGATATYKDSFDECALCLEKPESSVCLGNPVGGVLYDYPVFVGLLKNKTELIASLAVAELGVFPRCENCLHQQTFHWAIPDRRYIKENIQLPSSVYDILLDEISEFVGSDDFPFLLNEFDLKTSYEQIDPSYLGNVSSNIIYDYILLVESGILILCCIIIFSLGKVWPEHVQMPEDCKKPTEGSIVGDVMDLTMTSDSETRRSSVYISHSPILKFEL